MKEKKKKPIFYCPDCKRTEPIATPLKEIYETLPGFYYCPKCHRVEFHKYSHEVEYL